MSLEMLSQSRSKKTADIASTGARPPRAEFAPRPHGFATGVPSRATRGALFAARGSRFTQLGASARETGVRRSAVRGARCGAVRFASPRYDGENATAPDPTRVTQCLYSHRRAFAPSGG